MSDYSIKYIYGPSDRVYLNEENLKFSKKLCTTCKKGFNTEAASAGHIEAKH